MKNLDRLIANVERVAEWTVQTLPEANQENYAELVRRAIEESSRLLTSEHQQMPAPGM